MLLFSSVVVVVLSRGAMQTLFSQSSVSSLGRTEEGERANSPYLLKRSSVMKLELKQQVLNKYCDGYENVT